MKRKILLDSSAILNDFNFSFSKELEYFTTSKIISEFRDVRSKSLIDSALQQGLLKIIDPKPETITHMIKKASSLGFQKLSAADVSLLALAFEFQNAPKLFTVITDDYSIQNFCKLMNMNFEGIIHPKIEKVISFKTVCPNCGKEFSNSSKLKKCDICSARLKKVK